MNPIERASAEFGWGRVVRVGVVQAGIGAVVVLMTSTLNRVMVVELGLPAAVPGLLVFLHFVVQLVLRPRLGFASDRSGRRSTWILGGMALLAASGTLASASTILIASSRSLGLAIAVLAFLGLAAGVSAAGTPLLALLSERTASARRPRAAAIVWLMMIAGFILTTAGAGGALTPFSFTRLVVVTAAVGGIAFLAAVLAVRGLEGPAPLAAATPASAPAESGFASSLAQVWADPSAQRFTVFVLASMLAYSAQDLILEPFAGAVFGLSPARSTQVSSLHQGGMLVGMLLTAALAARVGSVREWAVGGCLVSAFALAGLALSPMGDGPFVMRGAVFALGLGNGCFAIAALGSMMAMAGRGPQGIRMGVFGGAQAVAFAVGGLAGAAGSDAARTILGDSARGYGAVFIAEAAVFALAAALAAISIPHERAAAVLTATDRGSELMGALG